MSLKDLLSEKKSLIVKKWFNSTINAYPSDSSHFLKTQKDPFLNPVGSIISKNIAALFDEILCDVGSERIYPYINDIMKVNAIQGFAPSKAVAFIYTLKHIIKDELETDIEKYNLDEELKLFEKQLDELTFLSFDIYMKCRENIFEIRIGEIKNMTFGLLKSANLISEFEAYESDIKADTVLTQNIKG